MEAVAERRIQARGSMGRSNWEKDLSRRIGRESLKRDFFAFRVEGVQWDGTKAER